MRLTAGLLFSAVVITASPVPRQNEAVEVRSESVVSEHIYPDSAALQFSHIGQLSAFEEDLRPIIQKSSTQTDASIFKREDEDEDVEDSKKQNSRETEQPKGKERVSAETSGCRASSCHWRIPILHT